MIFKLVPEDRFFQIMEDFHRLVARRAYELFSASGFTHGHDLADWLQGESEILKPVHCEISDTDDVITAKAAVPGYDAKDIEIHVEPQRVFVSGEQQENSEESDEKDSPLCTALGRDVSLHRPPGADQPGQSDSAA